MSTPSMPAQAEATVRGPRLLRPLRHRDFALLTAANTISRLGNGFFAVALAWAVYDRRDSPSALSLVTLVWLLPTVLLLLPAGVVADRVNRRLVMIPADLVRALALAGMGGLALAGRLELWHIVALIGFVGAGDAFFGPAATALVPTLLPEEDLPAANALDGMLRPTTNLLVGPAVGGLVVGAVGPGAAFLFDAVTFLLSAVAVALIRDRTAWRQRGDRRRPLHELGEGVRFVRANPWCWTTLAAAAAVLLLFYGPLTVLLPYRVKNDLHEGAAQLGLVYTAGGVATIALAAVIGSRPLPRRRVTFMFGCFGVSLFGVAAYGVMTQLWQALLACALFNALTAAGEVMWVTLLQQRVPRPMLGRVASVDGFVSISLIPLSLALTGPAAAVLGVGRTLVLAGLLSALVWLIALFVPGARDPDREHELLPGATSPAPGA